MYVKRFQDELQTAAVGMGYNFKAVTMETLTVKEQVQTVLCSKVLIGVSGKSNIPLNPVVDPGFRPIFFLQKLHENKEKGRGTPA